MEYCKIHITLPAHGVTGIISITSRQCWRRDYSVLTEVSSYHVIADIDIASPTEHPIFTIRDFDTCINKMLSVVGLNMIFN